MHMPSSTRSISAWVSARVSAWASAFAVALVALAVCGCSDPTLEEACAEYCDTIESAGCDHPTAKECSAQCDGLREQLDGQCIEEYTETFDCGADLDFECRDGNAVATDTGCLEEAFALLECAGLGTDASTDEGSSSPQ
jgi:hypothetical protein